MPLFLRSNIDGFTPSSGKMRQCTNVTLTFTGHFRHYIGTMINRGDKLELIILPVLYKKYQQQNIKNEDNVFQNINE